MPNPEFEKLLQQMKEIHDKKSHDYTSAGPFQNFDRSAELASWFKNDTDKAFVVLIGTKLARLATLLDSGRQPNNESVADSFLDLCTYCALWASYHATMRRPPTVEQLEAILDDNTQLDGTSGKVHISVPANSKICYTCKTRIMGTVAVGERIHQANYYYHASDDCLK